MRACRKWTAQGTVENPDMSTKPEPPGSFLTRGLRSPRGMRSRGGRSELCAGASSRTQLTGNYLTKNSPFPTYKGDFAGRRHLNSCLRRNDTTYFIPFFLPTAKVLPLGYSIGKKVCWGLLETFFFRHQEALPGVSPCPAWRCGLPRRLG